MGRATTLTAFRCCHPGISIHALRGEGDVSHGALPLFPHEHFNPRPPWGGRPSSCPNRSRHNIFQSTPSVGRATSSTCRLSSKRRHFNPRPPWGGRHHCIVDIVIDTQISIHALRGEGDETPQYGISTHFTFQSTPSVGRATPARLFMNAIICISIHALRGEGDKKCRLSSTKKRYFNPRPPWGGRHDYCLQILAGTAISIHALRGEGDTVRKSG